MKTVQSFCTVSESLANFLKSSQLRENSTESTGPGRISGWRVGRNLQRPPGVVGARISARISPTRPQAPPGVPARTLPRAPQPGVLLCALAPAGARRPARLPAAEVTVSPKRSHSPGSMNPDRARGTGPGARTPVAEKGRRARRGGLALQPRGPRPALVAAPRARAGSCLRRSHASERAAHPCAAPAVGSGFSGARTTPSPPRPPEGLGLPRGAFEPGARRGSPPSAGGKRAARRPEAHPAGRGRRGRGARRGRGTRRGRDGGREAERRTLQHMHTRAPPRTPPPRWPGTGSSHLGALRAINGCAARLLSPISGPTGRKAALLGVHRMTPYPCTDRPGKAPGVLYTRDSRAPAGSVSLPLPGARSQWVWAVAGEQSQPRSRLAVWAPGLAGSLSWARTAEGSRPPLHFLQGCPSAT